MKKVNLISLIVIGFVATFISCSKNDSPANDPPKPVCRIVTVTPSSGHKVNISYNFKGKISSIISGSNSKTLQYSGDSLFIKETELDSFISKTTVTLNQYGLAMSAKKETNVSGTSWINVKYGYNGKELTKITTTSSGGMSNSVRTFKWVNGNPTTLTVGPITATIEYYDDQPVQVGDYWNLIRTLEEGYYFIAAKNPIKSIISTSGINNNYSYTMDADGKFTDMSVDDGTQLLLTFTYQYECN